MFHKLLKSSKISSLIISILLVGCNGSIMDSQYIKTLTKLISNRYEVSGEAYLLAKVIASNPLEEKSLQCLRNYNNVATSVNTVIDEIRFSILADTDLPLNADLTSQITQASTSSQDFIKCSKDLTTGQTANLIPGIEAINIPALITSILPTIQEIRQQQINQRQKVAEELNQLKLSPFTEYFPKPITK